MHLTRGRFEINSIHNGGHQKIKTHRQTLNELGKNVANISADVLPFRLSLIDNLWHDSILTYIQAALSILSVFCHIPFSWQAPPHFSFLLSHVRLLIQPIFQACLGCLRALWSDVLLSFIFCYISQPIIWQLKILLLSLFSIEGETGLKKTRFEAFLDSSQSTGVYITQVTHWQI